MRIIYSFVLALFLNPIFGVSQIYDPVDWSFSKQKISENTYELTFVADIDQGWAIYSNDIYYNDIDCDVEICPLPVSFEFTKDNDLESYYLIGDIKEVDENKSISQDPIFLMEVTKFTKKASFKQVIELKAENINVSGYLTFMVCDDTKCLPPTDVEFEFNIGEPTKNNSENNEVNIQNVEESNLSLYGFLPEQIKKQSSECDTENETVIENKDNSLLSIFLLGILGGFLALLTPCVFPMIPLTVSFFTKKNENDNGISNAILYGFFIFLVYIILSIPFHLLDSVNPDILNDISTNIYLNVLFFLVFLVFAFSFFGYFELTLPSSWTSKSTSQESKTGFVGIFFMALTLAIVSFSCTGPILGTLLAGSLSGDSGAWELTAGMSGFGLALGFPFALFAMFPNVLNKLPKSGGWLNTIKVTLGFIELALALKFLSNADLVAHWGILKIELFLALWFIIFFLLGIYLIGKISFPNEVKLEKISGLRLLSAILAFGFSVYLASGLIYDKEKHSYNALSLLSGLAPPLGYSYFSPKDCPNDLDCFKDLKTGIEYAKKGGKPILLDFTGYACVNCRKMEEHVWPLPEVDKVLRDNFVLISLYVDDKKKLPEFEQLFVKRTSGVGTRKLENYGHKWAHFQASYFGVNSQPFYLIMDPNTYQILNDPVGYMPDANEYISFLECGLSEFKSLNEE
jgi:thiol:disulfide interchange protein|tara:strand:+ start:2068 stop:4125 length:2058 start_codon:yes stop_codon:yes gene_type:complete